MKSSFVRRKNNNEGFNFWPSFADLCVAFTFFWILIVIVAIITPAFSEGMIRRQILNKVRETMNESLPESYHNRFELNEKTATIQLKDTDLFFASGSAVLSPEGAKVVTALAIGLRGALDEHGEKIDTVLVEGFADSAPIVGGDIKKIYPTNWELSTARACSVLRHIVEKSNLDYEITKKFCAAGYGNSRAKHLEKPDPSDRRIEIRIITSN